MPTIATRPSRLPGRTPHRLTMWMLGAVLVAAVAVTLAVSLIGSDHHQAVPSADAAQAAPQAPTEWGGARP